MKKRKLSKEEIENLLDFLKPNTLIPIESATVIIENLKKKEDNENELKNVSINQMVHIANKTVKNYLSSLNENEKRKLESILLESDQKLKLKYEVIKEDVIDKLMDLKS